ncbi:hypothetical protein H632_c1355p0, partial [Helicosporidium sp. ATCC 50920]
MSRQTSMAAAFLLCALCALSIVAGRPVAEKEVTTGRSLLQAGYLANSQCPDAGELLFQTNVARAYYGAAPLAWNADMAARAQAWANGCSGQHSYMGYGENIYITYGAPSCSSAMTGWFWNEASHYNYNQPGFQLATGHFTQLVWAGTTQMGCGIATCPIEAYPSGNKPNQPWQFVV